MVLIVLEGGDDGVTSLGEGLAKFNICIENHALPLCAALIEMLTNHLKHLHGSSIVIHNI
jgi:hypothetical protein